MMNARSKCIKVQFSLSQPHTELSPNAFLAALPAMALAALLLLPFLNTPFTIDDPIYLREAGQILADPLHPQAFNIVWSTDLSLRASQILPGGILAPYLLVPTALAGYAEWVGHLTQLLLLLAAIYGTACIAVRLGLNRRQATIVTIPDCCMPRGSRHGEHCHAGYSRHAFHHSWHGTDTRLARHLEQPSALASGLPRNPVADLRRAHPHTYAHRVGPGLRLPARWHHAARNPFLVQTFPGALPASPTHADPVFLANALTADPEPGGENILITMFRLPGGLHIIAENSFAFLAHWVLVIPLTIPWIILRPRTRTNNLILAGLLAASVLSLRFGWVAFPAIASLIVLADILRDAIERRDRVQLALWLWLVLALPVVVYIHLPSKYLLPSVPAAVILLVRLIPDARPETVRWMFPAIAAAEVILGLLIILGVRDLAQTQRNAVETIVKPHIAMGQHVWFAGHWGFQWYAEEAGAQPVTRRPPLPQPGDIIVVSLADYPLFASQWTSRTVLDELPYTGSAIGRVMDVSAGAGFFSNHFGYLPWFPGAGEATRFEVWKVE